MSTVLVTGGAGFIGSNTVNKLVELKSKRVIDDIIVLDNFTTGTISNLKDVRQYIKIIDGDVRYPDRYENLIKNYNVEYILHLAAVVSLEEVYENPRLALETNVLGTLNMLELARKHDVKRFVYASSVAVYGEPVELPIKESHPTKPANLYGLTKLMGEHLALQYSKDYGIEVISLRYFNVYGPRMRKGPYGGVIYKFISSLIRGERPVIYGDGTQTRDFVYVDDVAEANIKALFAKIAKSDKTLILNIGSSTEISILQLLKIICNMLGKNIQPEFKPARKGDVKRSMADISKAREALSWTPKTSITEGLKKTIEDLRRKDSQ